MPTKYDRGFFVDENAPAGQAISELPDANAAAPNKYDDQYFLSDGNSTPEELGGALTSGQIAALAGGAAGAMLGKHAVSEGTGPLARGLENLYGAPKGSLAEVHNLTQPLSADAVAQQVAAQHIPPVSGETEVSAQRPTPGGRYSEKTGYGIGEGTVAEVNERRQRAKSHGKITSKLEKKFGIPEVGQSAQLSQRLIDNLRLDPTAEAKIQEQLNAEAARKSTLEQMAENIRKAGGAYGVAKHAMRTGLNVGSGILGGLHGFQGLSDMQQQGLNLENASQTAEGASLLAAMRNPTVGLPLAGGASVANAGNKMYEQGVNTHNAAQMLSGAGMAVMPRNPIVGTAMQLPSAAVFINDWLLQNPKYIPAWLKAQNQKQ